MAIDQNDLKILYENHHEQLFNFALRCVFDLGVAEELVHESFLLLWEKRDKVRGDSAKSYLFKVIQNKAINMMRRRRLFEKVGVALSLKFVGDTESPESDMGMKQDLRRVKEALEKLPLHYKKVLLLSYFGDFNMKEIARILELPEGTVASRKSRAMDMIRDNFNRESGYVL